MAALIEAEYVPLMSNVEGFISYPLVNVGNDEVASIGIFSTAGAADEANAVAHSWSVERLGPLVTSPLPAASGSVLVHTGS